MNAKFVKMMVVERDHEFTEMVLKNYTFGDKNCLILWVSKTIYHHKIFAFGF